MSMLVSQSLLLPIRFWNGHNEIKPFIVYLHISVRSLVYVKVQVWIIAWRGYILIKLLRQNLTEIKMVKLGCCPSVFLLGVY